MTTPLDRLKDKMGNRGKMAAGPSAPDGQHLAAVLHEKGGRLKVETRPTPQPGPNELLLETHAIALNPVDWFQRDTGIYVSHYPAVFGSDIVGTVLATGSSVSADSGFKPGARVTALATAYDRQGEPDYGGMQKRLIVPAANACVLPDSIRTKEGTLFPMAVATALAGWYSIGLPRDTKFTEADNKGLLVLGGASSVGSAAVQSARDMGFKVLATASENNFDMVKALGAHEVFDYKKEAVEQDIIAAAKRDGITVDIAYNAAGQVDTCINILSVLKSPGTVAKVAAALPPSGAGYPSSPDIEVKFVAAPLDAEERTEHFHYIFNVWLKEKLATGQFVPSPRVRIVEGGLEAMDTALDILKEGKVSGEKLVLEL